MLIRSPKFSSNIFVKSVIDVLRNKIESADSLKSDTHLVTKRNNAGQAVHQHMKETEFARMSEEKLPDQKQSSSKINIVWKDKSKCETVFSAQPNVVLRRVRRW